MGRAQRAIVGQGNQEQGDGRQLRQRRDRVGAEGDAATHQRARLRRPGVGQGRALTRGWRDRQLRMGKLGTHADTGQFAVESIRRWWHAVGQTNYPAARRVLITADSGGSNGSRLPGSGFGRPSWPASRLRPTIVESTTVLLPHKILRQFLLRRTRWCGGRLRHGRHAVAQYTTSVGTNP